MSNHEVLRRTHAGALETNRVLRNTYALLAMTLLFSAAMAAVSMSMNLPYPGVIVTLLGYFGLLWLTSKFSHRALGLLFVFALTGFMGLTLGPILNVYVSHFANGEQLVMTALGGTGLTFLGLSAYALGSRKDFSFMGGMLTAGVLVAFVASLAALFMPMPGLQIAVSAMFILLMAGMILWQTSAIVHGGERNYILATVSLYVAIFNLFTSLLQLLGLFDGDE